MPRGVPVQRVLPPSQNLDFTLPVGPTQYDAQRPPRIEEPGAWPKQWTPSRPVVDTRAWEDGLSDGDDDAAGAGAVDSGAECGHLRGVPLPGAGGTVPARPGSRA